MSGVISTKGYRFGGAFLLLLGCLFAAAKAEEPRVSLHFFKYSGVHDTNEAAKNQFDNFKAIIHAKISSISEELSSRQHFAELNKLGPFFPTDADGNHVEWEGSNAKLLERWRNARTLEIFLGRIRIENGAYSVRSRVYLGDLRTELDSKFIVIDLPIADDQYDTTVDSHSVAILYALAMDARERCRPEFEVLELLSAAKERLADVPADVAGVEKLRAAVERGFHEPRLCDGSEP